MEEVPFDRGTCYLIKRKRGLPRALGEPEKKVSEGALIDINSSRIFGGEACLQIRLYPRIVCLDLSERFGLNHLLSFSPRIFSGTSFCRSFLRSTLSENGIL